ncbi:hypothetical protein KY289_004524 [Solanum tuberosum]|nr:hypothetical protein KY289_004524 [Solanum tuberosum]
MEKTPRKSPRLNKSVVIVDSPPISSRPSGISNEFIVINSSSSYKVQQKDDYGADTKSKGKEKLVEDHYPHDSDFEDGIPLSKRLRVNNDQYSKNVDGGSVSKGMNGLSKKWTRFVNNKRKKASQVPLKIKKKQSRWCSYVNVNVFVDITKLLEKIGSVHLFKESPFGYLLGLSQLKVQPQIIRCLVHHLANNRDDMFVFDINGKEMHFGLREFLNSTFKLLSRYFPNAVDKVLKADFIRVFKEDGTFILSSPPQLSHIPKDHFLCVESGQYITYLWGNLSFFNLRHSISSQMAKDPDYVKFEGFPLALQIWFYECCNKVDGSIAIRKSNRTPRIFNWDISKNKIYFDHLQKGMFRKYGNQYTFEDLVFMDEELHIIESKNLIVLTDMPFNKKSKRDRYVRQNQNLQTHSVVRQNVKDLPHSSAQKVGSDPRLSFNKDLQKIAQEVVKVRNELEKLEKNVDAKFVEMKAFMDSSFKYIIQELKSLRNDVSTNKDLGGERVVVEDQRKGNVDVQNEHLQDCGDKDGVQTPSSFRGVSVDFEINRKTPTLDDFVMPNMRESQLVALETGQTYVSSLVDVESENICVTPLEVAKAGKTKFNQFGAIEGENTFISPVQHVRTKIPGKYAQSPYTNLSESGGTSVNTVKYCLWRHSFVNYKGFDMYIEVILQFKKWVDSKLSKKRGKKTSFFTAASNPIDLPFEFGVGRVDLMDWFHLFSLSRAALDKIGFIVVTEICDFVLWGQLFLHVDVIMYYLRKFCKYGPDNSARVTTIDPFFISWVVQIYDAWEANGKDESLISIHHEVAQYIRGDRILANIPWVDVDHVCIPVNSSAAFHWFLVVFSIRKRCLYIYDSLNGYGVKHTNAVTSLVKKKSRMIHLFLVATDYYALRKDIDWNTDVHYVGRPVGDPLVYGNRENIPQQCDNSTDCGLYTCAFAEYVCRGDRNVSMLGLNAENLRLRFGALLWEYGKMKIDTESVSEDEASNQGRRSNRRVKE